MALPYSRLLLRAMAGVICAFAMLLQAPFSRDAIGALENPRMAVDSMVWFGDGLTVAGAQAEAKAPELP